MTPFMSEINEDMLRQFEQEFEMQKSKLEQAREMIKHKKSLAIQKEVEGMRVAVSELDKTVVEARETRQTLRKRLMERKALMKIHVAEHQELQRSTWSMERAHELEYVAQKRLDLERIHDERLRMESLVDAATIELDAIDGEKRRRQESVDVQLKRILDKGTVLKEQLELGHLDIPLVRQTIQEQDHDHFVEECHGLRRQQQHQRILDLHTRQKQLNLDRSKLFAEEDALRQQMQQHASTQSLHDGLGDSPKKILPTPPTNSFPESDDCVDDVLVQASRILASGDATLSALQESIEAKSMEIKANAATPSAVYDGSLGPQTYPPWLHATRAMVHSILSDVVTSLPLSMFQTMRSLKQQRKQWRATQRRLAKAHRRQVTSATIQTIHQSLIDDVVEGMLRDVHDELEAVARRVNSVVAASLVSSLQTQLLKDSATQPSQHASAFQELQLRRVRQDNAHRPFGWLFPQHALSQPLAKNPLDTAAAPEGTTRKWFGGKESNDSTKAKPQPPQPLRVPSIRQVSIDGISRVAPPTALVTMEASCWKHVLFQSVAKVALPITAACVHMCRVQGRGVLCAGGSKGEVVLVDLATSAVLRQRLDPPHPGRISAIQSYGAHLLEYASSQLKLWTTRLVKEMGISVVFRLTKDDLNVPGRELQEITTGCFVPAVSLAGTSTSILVGTADGSIFRLNRSTDECRPVFGVSSSPAQLGQVLHKAVPPMILPPNPRQELCQFHRAAIVFLACPSATSILSVDAAGVVCHWTNANWTGFGWHEPAQTMQVVGSGVVQSCQLTTDKSRLVVFTFDAAKRQGALVQLAYEPSLSVLPVVIRIGCGSPPPPFALLPRPAALSRTACDCVLVMGSSIALYSLATGQVLTPASASTMECKSPAVSVSCSDGYVVGCGTSGKVMAFQMQDLSSIEAVHAVQRELAPFNSQTHRPSSTIVRAQHAGDHSMVRAMVTSIVDHIVGKLGPLFPSQNSTIVPPPVPEL